MGANDFTAYENRKTVNDHAKRLQEVHHRHKNLKSTLQTMKACLRRVCRQSSSDDKTVPILPAFHSNSTQTRAVSRMCFFTYFCHQQF